MSYELLDSGNGEKWERFGEYILCRPSPQAVWKPKGDVVADATFTRKNQWAFRKKLPRQWEMRLGKTLFQIMPTDFGHLGIFPEHQMLWEWMRPRIQNDMRVLNLFAYSGGATLAAAQEGASVCHLDASKGMVQWACENAQRNGLEKKPIRWIVDDALKFLKREKKRGSFYEGIILDPPTFGRGSKGEVFKIERDILSLLEACRDILSEKSRFLIFSCHTPGFSPIVLKHLLEQIFQRKAEAGEMLLESPRALSIPSGAFARIER